MHRNYRPAFTLAELLIALAILGVIATFTIPKVLQSQQNEKWKTSAKEVLAAVSGAYQTHRIRNTVNDTDTLYSVVLPYLNYIKIVTDDSHIDLEQGDTYEQCHSWNPCYRFATGALLWFWSGKEFGGTATTNAINFFIDPDGVACETPTCNGKSVQGFLYYDGTLRTAATARDPTCDDSGCWYSPDPSKEPPWFSW